MTTKLVGESSMAASVTSAASKPAAARTTVVWCGLLALCASIFGLSPPALAETLSISATGLVSRCPCGGDTTDIAEQNNGVFEAVNSNRHYFVPVVFPVTTGQKVCKFTMAYEDINASDAITARLMRKSYTVGGNPFTAPTVIATVHSASGVSSTVREASTTTINSPTITVAKSFYYIDVGLPTTNLNILGFQIVYKPTCP